MSEPWMGLHNPERHFKAFGDGTCLCEECENVLCLPCRLCRCCLAAEVEALRYKRDADRDERMQLRDELDKARAQVQRVRELHRECTTVPVSDGGCTADEHDSDAGDSPVCVLDIEDWPCRTLRALDGDDDE